jgi:hypothetical protein
MRHWLRRGYRSRAFDTLATLAEYFMGETDLANRICAAIDVQRRIDPAMADAGASSAVDTLTVAGAQVCWPRLPSDPVPRNRSSPARRPT